MLVVLLTALTNVTVFSPVNAVVQIIVGLEQLPLLVYAAYAVLALAAAFALDRVARRAFR